jgi:gamma-glutamyltranspeptidase/glutathione hydrolase
LGVQLTPPTRGVVAAGDPQTADAGAWALRQGGNAADAAVSAALAAFVCELPLASPLGGGVLVAAMGSEPPLALDFFTRTPGLGLERPQQLDFRHVEVDFGATKQVFHVGRAAAAVPLALPGLLEAHRRWGKLPLGAVVEPALDLARSGYVLGSQVAYVFYLLVPIVTLSPDCRALYFDGDGIAQAGARLRNPDLAATLEDIARRPDRLKEVYAQLAREFSPREGGLITPADVGSVDAVFERPVSVEHAGMALHTMPPPSSGGVLVALGLKLLHGVGKEARFLSPGHLLSLVRVQDALLDVRDERFDANCHDRGFVDELLTPERIAAVRARLGTAQGRTPGNPLGSTTHISALDELGGAMSMTLTNGEGCGHVVGGTGMVVNNMLGEEDIHPRGFHLDAPGTRLATMMAPTVLQDRHRTIALGSGGSNRLRTAVLSVASHLVEHGVSASVAVDAPRVHLEPRRDRRDATGRVPRQIAFELPGLDPPTREALLDAYPDEPVTFDRKNMFFGGVHVAMRDGRTFSGAGDARRGGSVVVVE